MLDVCFCTCNKLLDLECCNDRRWVDVVEVFGELMFIELVVFMGCEMLCSSQIIEIVVSVEFSFLCLCCAMQKNSTVKAGVTCRHCWNTKRPSVKS